MSFRGTAVTACVLVAGGVASAAHVVQTGSIAEGRYGVETAETLTREGCGTLINLFAGKWTPEKVRAVGEHCRKHGCIFTMDEMFDRITGTWKKEYEPGKDALLSILREYADVCKGTQHYSETGGVMFYWPIASVMSGGEISVRVPDTGGSLSRAYAATCEQVCMDLQRAKKALLPAPYFSIECSFGFAPYLLRAGYDRVDLEVIYSDELERAYAGVKTASEAFGRKGFGADMAMAWYGGMQSDALWETRWRTSLRHAYIRGADPIYNEHGLMSLLSHGRDFDHDHPVTLRYRKVLSDFTSWCRAHPRADGYPVATVGAIQGRLDGYAGVFQTHIFGQRTNEACRVTDADLAWRLFDTLYRRRSWQDRDRWGAADFSGNPPLGAAGILPFDAPGSAFAKYRLLFFLGRNIMDDALYQKLLSYVNGGGTLVLAASHLTVQDSPSGEFVPYNGGDWSRLAGVKAKAGKWHLPHGVKFVGTPGPGWNFQPMTDAWDPDFADGGFEVPDLETMTAKPVAVASDRFQEKDLSACRGVLYVNEVGKGRVVFVASLDSPGASGVRRLYSFLLGQALDAVGKDVWPKVECTDAVRWSVYPDGTLYLLNTEVNTVQEAVVATSASAPRRTVKLAPGEIRELRTPLPANESGKTTFSLKEVAGVPRIAVNGTPMVGMAAMPKPNTGKDATDAMRDFNALGVKFFTEHFAGGSHNYRWWLGEGKYDFNAFDALVKELRDASPNGFIFPRIDMNPPRWWKIENPAEVVWGKRFSWPKAGSEPWRNLWRRMLEDVVHHVENSPYADKVMGYHISAMHGGEWQTWEWPQEDEPPIEWKDDRDPLPPLLATKARRAYARKRNRDVADSILMASELVKNLTGGRKLVGVFYGYMETGDHEDFARVIRSPHVDFIASPGSYNIRRGGQSGRFQMSWPASCRLHGKLYYDEADLRTCLVKETAANKTYRCVTPDESVGVIKRNLGYALTGGWELWWFLIESNETFRDERFLAPVRTCLEEMRNALSSASWKPADVAVFTSPDEYSTGVFATHRGHPLRTCCKVGFHNNVLPFTGVAYDSYDIADIEDERLPDYKVYVFPNAFALSEGRRDAIKRRVRRTGKTAIWFFAPGYYRKDEGSAANIEELTGVHVKENYPVKSTLLTRTFTIDGDGTFCTNGWRSVYLALPKVETPDVAWDVGVLRKVFADAGAHIWIDTPEIVAAGRGYLMVHAASDGEKTIRLPSRCDVKEVYDACPPLKSVIEFKDVFKKGETRIYQLRGLHRRGEWGDTVDDPKAGDGKAIKIFNTHFQWCVQLPMDRIAFEVGRKYRLSVRVRVDKARDGEAFCAGIFSKAASLVRRGIEVKTADVQDDEYRWYDVIAWVPAPDEYFWFAPGRFDTDGKSAVNGVYIDKIKFSLAEWT